MACRPVILSVDKSCLFLVATSVVTQSPSMRNLFARVRFEAYPVLPFLFFLEKREENQQKNKDFYPHRTPKIPGKIGKNAKKNKEFLAREKNKEIPKNKERKDRVAHRNRSDFCDLRLRCPTRTPEIARFRKQEKAMLHCDLRVRDGKSLAICDFGLRCLSPKPLLSAGFLAIFSQRGNR